MWEFVTSYKVFLLEEQKQGSSLLEEAVCKRGQDHLQSFGGSSLHARAGTTSSLLEEAACKRGQEPPPVFWRKQLASEGFVITFVRI
jgi:hypothetical protein